MEKEEQQQINQQLSEAAMVHCRRLDKLEKQMDSVLMVVNIAMLAVLVYVAWPTLEKTFFPQREEKPPATE